MDLAVSVHGLRKEFGAVKAVNGVDLDVKSGEVLALLGPNGAGKTTIVEILEGYQTASDGKVSVLGLDPRHDRRRMLERVGIVLQETAVEQFLTVREVLKRRAAYYPHPRDPDSVIELVGLEEKARAQLHTLSGGQRHQQPSGASSFCRAHGHRAGRRAGGAGCCGDRPVGRDPFAVMGLAGHPTGVLPTY